MDLGLQGKRALVTGSTAGIGFATAKLLAAEGASVIVNGCEALARAVPAVDILVNNVGIFEPKPFEEIPDEDWLRFFEVNVMSGVRLARRYLAGMRAKNWGSIVFVSSESALQIPVEMVHYGMTKTAQLAVARGIAETTAGTGITVNSVLPGPTASEGVALFVEQMAKARGVDFKAMEQEFFATARPSSLLRRCGSTAESCAPSFEPA